MSANPSDKPIKTNAEKIIILAGATGGLGMDIAENLTRRGARVRAIVQPGSSSEKIAILHKSGVETFQAEYQDVEALAKICEGGTCVVSALSGLREVIVDAQTNLLNAAVKAKVLRFIPSDFAIDFTKLPYGQNRNLDLRKEFSEVLDKAPIQATSILNGMFTDLLTGQAPVVLFSLNRIMYWGNPDQLMDFTSRHDTATFTAIAALDQETPRYLRIAGDQKSARGLQETASKATGKEFGLLRIGSLGVLKVLIKLTKAFSPETKEVFPPWQGMQYLHDMLSGLPKLQPLDNDRYPELKWTTVEEVLKNRR